MDPPFGYQWHVTVCLSSLVIAPSRQQASQAWAGQCSELKKGPGRMGAYKVPDLYLCLIVLLLHCKTGPSHKNFAMLGLHCI